MVPLQRRAGAFTGDHRPPADLDIGYRAPCLDPNGDRHRKQHHQYQQAKRIRPSGGCGYAHLHRVVLV